MWTSSRKPENIEARRKELLEKGFEVFSERGIESVTMQDVADAVGCGIASLYRYFDKKPGFVVEVAAWKWDQVKNETFQRWSEQDAGSGTAAELFELHLDAFLEIYRKHTDLLRFNQFFNIYIHSENIDTETLSSYQGVILSIREWFHTIYLKAEQDHTIRTDETEEEMFSTTLHLMLAAVTRYAVGLVYIPESGFDAERELIKQKEMLLARYMEH